MIQPSNLKKNDHHQYIFYLIVCYDLELYFSSPSEKEPFNYISY
jgi:hypothetical protein